VVIPGASAQDILYGASADAMDEHAPEGGLELPGEGGVPPEPTSELDDREVAAAVAAAVQAEAPEKGPPTGEIEAPETLTVDTVDIERVTNKPRRARRRRRAKK